MKKIITVAAAVALSLSVLTTSALADSSPATREANCLAMTDAANGITAAYQVGNVNTSRCNVESVGQDVAETTEQVNNPNAKKAVVRVVKTTTETKTTQVYEWEQGSVKNWVALGQPTTELGATEREQCMQTPGLDKCA